MIENIIPESLDAWVVAYEKIGDDEYEFYLRDLPLEKVRVKATKSTDFNFYTAVTNYGIKHKQMANVSYIPSGKSEDPICAIIMALAKFINYEQMNSLTKNVSYPGTKI